MHKTILRGPLLLLALLALLSGCASPPSRAPGDDRLAIVPAGGDAVLDRHAPVVVLEAAAEPHNRVGTVVARLEADNTIRVRVDPARATYYAERRTWSSAKATYTNLVYRLHFAEVPFSLLPFYLGAGDNVGLLFIVTLDDAGVPLLYTTVHTCGCYLAFLPTRALPPSALPPDWPRGRQSVYGETLPALLEAPEGAGVFRMHLLLRDATHRVRDIWAAPVDHLGGVATEQAILRPMAELETLTLDSGLSASMFETDGSRLGYVRGSHKIWERLLMGWWALDWRVGEDKKLGRNTADGPVFYTSLKPWAREASDLRDFAAFLRYWQWDL